MLTITISLGWRGRRPATQPETPTEPTPDPMLAPNLASVPAPRAERLEAPVVQVDDAGPDDGEAGLYVPGTDPRPTPHHHNHR